MAMSSFEPWDFRAGADCEDLKQLIGYKVVATDGEVGAVDDISSSPGRPALVVDTGEWVVGQHILIPAGTVKHINHEEMEISVDRSTTEIKAAPPYEPGVYDASYLDRLADYYCGLYSGIA
jgi:uncharacterized protein YrrD